MDAAWETKFLYFLENYKYSEVTERNAAQAKHL